MRASASAVLAFLVCIALPPGTLAKESKLKPGVTRYSDGTVVRRNADGSIETIDTNPIVQTWGSASPPSSPGRARQSKKAIEKHGDVTVRRNADGSIETFDSVPSRSPTRSTKRRSPVRKATGGGSNHGGVYVRKNPDGSIETFDSN